MTFQFMPLSIRQQHDYLLRHPARPDIVGGSRRGPGSSKLGTPQTRIVEMVESNEY